MVSNRFRKKYKLAHVDPFKAKKDPYANHDMGLALAVNAAQDWVFEMRMRRDLLPGATRYNKNGWLDKTVNYGPAFSGL